MMNEATHTTSLAAVKRCNGCDQDLPLSGFSKNRRMKDGLQTRCKPCMRALQDKWRKENPEKPRELARRSYKNNAEKERARARRWYQDNPGYSKQWDAENPDKRKAAMQRYRARNKQVCAARVRAYDELHPEKKRARQKRAQKKWNDANRDRLTAYHSARRRGLRQLFARLKPEWQNQIIAIYRECKAMSEKTGIKHHVDHIFPIKARNSCGLHVPWNLQILPAHENMKKSNKVPQ